MRMMNDSKKFENMNKLGVNKMKKIVIFMAMILACFMSLGLSGDAKCDAGANIKFQVKNVHLQNGQYTVEGDFCNEGDTKGYVYAIELDTTVYDKVGNCIFSHSYSQPELMPYWVRAHTCSPFVVTLTNSNAHSYNGEIRWDVHSRVYFKTDAR